MNRLFTGVQVIVGRLCPGITEARQHDKEMDLAHFELARIAGLVPAALRRVQRAGRALPYGDMLVFGDSLRDAGQFPDTALTGEKLRFTNRLDAGQPCALNASTRLRQRLGISASRLKSSTSVVSAGTGRPDGGNWATSGYRRTLALGLSHPLSEALLIRPGYGYRQAHDDSRQGLALSLEL